MFLIFIFIFKKQCFLILVNKGYIYIYCRVTSCSPSPKEWGYEPNTINLQIVGERAGLLTNWTTASKDLKYKQTQKHM